MNKLPRIVIDTLLMTLLLAILALPISSLGLLNPKIIQQNSQVLSTQDTRLENSGEQEVESPVPYPVEYYLINAESTQSTESAN